MIWKESVMRRLLLAIFILIHLSGCVVVMTPMRRPMYEDSYTVVRQPVVIQREVVYPRRPVVVERHIIIQSPQRYYRHRHHHHHNHRHHRWITTMMQKDQKYLVFFLIKYITSNSPSYVFYTPLLKVDWMDLLKVNTRWFHKIFERNIKVVRYNIHLFQEWEFL